MSFGVAVIMTVWLTGQAAKRKALWKDFQGAHDNSIVELLSATTAFPLNSISRFSHALSIGHRSEDPNNPNNPPPGIYQEELAVAPTGSGSLETRSLGGGAAVYPLATRSRCDTVTHLNAHCFTGLSGQQACFLTFPFPGA